MDMTTNKENTAPNLDIYILNQNIIKRIKRNLNHRKFQCMKRVFDENIFKFDSGVKNTLIYRKTPFLVPGATFVFFVRR